MITPAWIGLGSNLGDRRGILDAAVAALADAPGVVVAAVSSYHETTPVGGPPGQGPFLNAAARLETTLDAHQLLATLLAIEDRAGRVRAARWGERTLDLDILIFGTRFLDSNDLKLPHPRMALRRFVLAPLAEIAPTIVDTMTRRTIADLLARLERRPRLLAIDGRDGRRRAEVFRGLVEKLPGFGISAKDLGDAVDPAAGTVEGYWDAVERKAVALRAADWIGETLHVPWIVADFSIGLELLRSPTSRSRAGKAEPGASREGMRKARAAEQAALTATFVLILPGEDEHRRRPGLLGVPQLWPESDESDEIVDEALAICRGIGGD